TEVPAGHKEKLPDRAANLGKEAGKLHQAAQAQDVPKANEALQRVNLQVRELRLDSYDNQSSTNIAGGLAPNRKRCLASILRFSVYAARAALLVSAAPSEN